MIFVKAIILALVEGITEFLPISSTGHMILVDEFVALSTDAAFTKVFLIVIQLPAILAVVCYFWKDLWPFHKAKEEQKRRFTLWFKIVLAFLPAAVFGLLLDDLIEAWLLYPVPVAIALVVGGIILIVVESAHLKTRFENVHDLGWSTALIIGFVQCLAMLPGTSRSAATIIGARMLGASRSVAAEFSFFLAIPTMMGATAYTLLKIETQLNATQWAVIAVGSVVAFLTAWAVVAFLMNYIRRHDFRVFGYYRIVLGAIVLIYHYVLTSSV